ncbi:putative xanthine dehydrogenase subunit A [Oxobacter pfennigii]|uniref:Putative xanthine dehydrogenase subunit A n=1 Tax=Oxobacter pfennigii TaxID=36849 RepID=A0A0P8WDS8_9CLOT|nr:XdhC/CoxI family protein [Oxobacter pfennigii]KPU46165.1 putative xanthine dehydrogenase subunit A [Oxobacter pfennigii]
MFESIYKNLLYKLKDGNECVILTYLEPKIEKRGAILDKLLISRQDLEDNLHMFSEDIKSDILKAFLTGSPITYSDNKQTILIEPFFPRPRLVILGGGHIAKPLVEFGTKVGFSVVVSDDRPTFANTARFPEAEDVICESFERVFDKLRLRQTDFVVIVTRGHRHDGICLRKTLNYSPAYVGMIGSKRRVREMMQQLETEGYSREVLDKVNSPIGLSIGAVTPEEIAISIIAQVISYRRAIGTNLKNKEKFNWPEFDTDVIREISEESSMPRALITIISSKGSVPRKAGAKMILFADGRSLGSIGGGCSEANILVLSRDIIANKGYSIEFVDMTGEVAEDEGMVCGGVMDVLIEAF